MNQPASQYFSPKSEVDREFSSVRNDTVLVNYADTDYLSPYTAAYTNQDPSRRKTKTLTIQVSMIL